MIGIYKITNKVNGKCYIGQAVDIEHRLKRHRNEYRNSNSKSYHYPLYRSMRKHGIENFLFEIVEECTLEELNDKEVFYIAKYNAYDNGYNQTLGGDDRSDWCKLTSEDIDEIIHRLKTTLDGPTQIAKEYGVGPTTIHNINVGDAYRRDNESYPIRPKLCTIHKSVDGNFVKKAKERFCATCGKPINQESTHCVVCRSIANRKVRNRPKPLDLAKMIKELGFEEVGRRFGVSGKSVAKWCQTANMPTTKKEVVDWYNEQMGIVPPPKPQKRTLKDRMKAVKQIDPNTGTIINIFQSIDSAGKFLGKSNGNHISEACRGLLPMAYGYIWEFV